MANMKENSLGITTPKHSTPESPLSWTATNAQSTPRTATLELTDDETVTQETTQSSGTLIWTTIPTFIFCCHCPSNGNRKWTLKGTIVSRGTAQQEAIIGTTFTENTTHKTNSATITTSEVILAQRFYIQCYCDTN